MNCSIFPFSSEMKTWTVTGSTDVLHAVTILSIYNRSKNAVLFFHLCLFMPRNSFKDCLSLASTFNTSIAQLARVHLPLYSTGIETVYRACFPVRFFFRVYAAKQPLSYSKFLTGM